jgi:cytochrome c nitrite reductase small subunit
VRTGWLVGLSLPGIVLAALVGVLLGSGAYTAHYAEALSYMSDDPRACVNCHIMREHYDGWQKASHHGVATCNDCHLPHDNFFSKYAAKSRNGFWHSEAFTFQNFHEPIRIHAFNSRILQANCVHCHAELVREIAGADHGGESLDCVRCHQRVGHGPSR